MTSAHVDEVPATDWSADLASDLADLRAAARRTDGQDAFDEAVTLRLKHHGLAGARLWIVGGRTGSGTRLSGVALRAEGELTLLVHPEQRSKGLGRALLDAALSGYDGRLTAWSHGNSPDAASLAGRTGFQRVRDLWVMRRPGDVPLPEPAANPSVVVRGYLPEDEAELLRVNAAAFADHPEQGAMDAEDLAARMAEDWFDPAGLLVARDAASDRMLGFHWTKVVAGGGGQALGEVYVVGIDPQAQGRGLGTLLTLAGLRHMTERGVDEIELYVESDNRAAIAVYDRLGFAHADADTHVQYLRDR